MKPSPQNAKPKLEKTDVPCLYRYTSNGVYYAWVRHQRKQKKQSLETTDKATAKRKLADFKRDLGKVDASQGKMTLRELSAKYLSTIANQAVGTVSLKTGIIKRLLEDFALGSNCKISKIKPSDLKSWIAGYGFGYLRAWGARGVTDQPRQ